MSEHSQRILVAGGTGFVGEAVRERLRSDGHTVRLLVRSREDFEAYQEQGFETQYGNVLDAQSLFVAMDGVDAVVNLVAIIRESGGATFEQINYHGTANLVDAACQAGVARFIQMSALGAGNIPDYPYHYTKWRAESYVKDRIPAWTIFRPSIVFGPSREQNLQFVSQLADLVRGGPIVPIPGDGSARFQPIHIDDVAAAFAAAVNNREAPSQTYEIAGPDVLTYREIAGEVAKQLGANRRFINVPIPLVRVGATVLGYLPGISAPVTTSQLDMLQIDNTTDQNAAPELLGRPLKTFRGGLEFLRSQNTS